MGTRERRHSSLVTRHWSLFSFAALFCFVILSNVASAASSDASLSNLVLSAGTLTPPFASGTISYTASVSNSTTSITVTPTVSNFHASVKVNGVSVPSGSPSGPISLNVGSNVINVVVTAQAGNTRTYTVTVTRAGSSNANLSNLVLSTGTLNPSFSPSVTSYTASVSNSTTSITVTPTVQEPNATVKVNGVSVPSGTPSGPISLNVGSNVINVVVTAQDGTTMRTYTVTVTRAASSNANLSNLVLSSGTLNPSFDPAVTSYTASVSNSTTSITVTPTVQQPNATVKVNGVSVPSGTPSGPINLNVGPNAISVVVTAQDGTTMRTYTVTVTRAASSNANLSNLVLSSGTLSPSFDPAVTSYTASVPNSTTSITVTPTVQQPNATVKVNGVSVPSGTPSGPISLNVGSNVINVVVTAQDGTTMRTYTVTVTRAASSNANLSNLVLSSGTLSPSFDPAVTSYTASVSNSTTSITVTPTVQEPNATVTVNGMSVPSGTPSGPINLNVGPNIINVVVTAQDSTTMKTYTVTVTRAGTSNANLSNLVLSSGTLNPSFDPAVTSYTASVSNSSTSITVTPTVQDSNATVKVNGMSVPSGTPSDPISLNVGTNVINVVVTAPDGTTMKTYTITVTRAASSNANLSNLVLSNGTLAPPFNPNTLSYSAGVSNTTASITVTPSAQDSTATITVNGNPVASGNASAPISLSVGHNTVVTVVTAQDGATRKTYTIDVLRAGSVNVTASAGETTAAYNTLKDAFHAINAGAHHGTIAISIDLDTTEITSAAINGSASYTSITITPNGARTVSGNFAAPLIDLNGVSNVTINGLNSNGNSLILSNASTSAVAPTSTIRFVNGAHNNLITNCTVLGSTTGSNATATASVLFHTSTSAGNSNNTVSFCNLGPAGANLPSKCIMGLGSSGVVNASNTIDSNNIFDFFSATASVTGISVQGNTNNWTISNNRIYQTAARVFAGDNLRYAGITVANTSGSYTISGNIVGFGAADGTGITGISGLTNTFRGIDADSVSTTMPTTVQSNIISGISQTTDATGANTATNFVGIMLGSTDGRFIVTGNSVGSLDGSSGITVTSSAGGGAITGIYDFSGQSNSISDNGVGSISIGGTGTTNGFRGILVNTDTGVLETINNNTIANVIDNQVGNYVMNGIQIILPSVSMTDNVIRNLAGNANGAAVVMSGITISSGSATDASTISQNTVHSLSNTETGGSPGAIYGIDVTFANQANVIERNLIHSIDVNSTLAGYQISGTVMRGFGSATFQNNMVRLGLRADGSSITTGFSIIGMRDIGNVTSSYYHNSVYIGGTNVASVSNTFAFNSNSNNTRNYQNNIFYNARSNASGGVANVAIAVRGTAPNPPGLTSNYNVLYANGSDGAIGFFNSTVLVTLADWQAATGQDANSRAGDPRFIAPDGTAATGDLHIQPDIHTPVEGAGILISSVTNDFDGESRSSLTPVDIGADAGSFAPWSTDANLSDIVLSDGKLVPAFDPDTTSYTASVRHTVTSITVTPTVEDSTSIVQVNGVPVPSGMPSDPINLSIGNNVITVFVQAEDEQGIKLPMTNKTYTVLVNRAAVPVVTNLSDSGPGSLRDALTDVLDGETITFNTMLHTPGVKAPMAVITLTSDELVINNNITIVGPGADMMTIARDASAAPFRIFEITPNHTVTIEGLTISGGAASDIAGGIYNDHSDLTVISCVLEDNNAFYGGGAIYNDGFEFGSATLVVSDSTLTGNTAGYGAAIVNDGFFGGTATLSINNTTLSDNTADGYGGAIYNSTGGTAELTINNSTLSGNDGQSGGAIYNDATSSGGISLVHINNSTFSSNIGVTGAAFYNDVGDDVQTAVQISNSTFADNTASGGGIYNSNQGSVGSSFQIGNTILKKGSQGANLVNAAGSITSAGYNLSDDDGSGFLIAGGDQINTDPMLGPLKDNGGSTFTHAPLVGSPAIDQGKRDTIPALTTDTDQRGLLRPVDDPVVSNAAGGDASDIGAVEVVAVHPTQASSRKTHGAAGDFDVNLPLVNFATSPIGVECRTGAVPGTHAVIVTFDGPVTFSTAAVTNGTGTVSSATGSGTNELTINLAGVTNVQTLTLALFDVDDGAKRADIGVRMRVRIGDVTGNDAINSSDVTFVKSRVGQAISTTNFRADVNANGSINASDVVAVKSRVGTP